MKQAKKQPGQSLPVYDKTSIIVLAVAAAVFLALLFWLRSEDILHGSGKLFSPFSDQEFVEYEKGTVVEILSDDSQPDEAADGAYIGSQQLSVKIKSGRYKGETLQVQNAFGPLSGVRVAEGDSVTLTMKTFTDGTHEAMMNEVNRVPVLACFLILFFLAVCLVGGRTGAKSLVGLIFTFVCLFAILIPLLFKGAPMVLTTLLVCAYIALVSFTVLGGVHRKTISAFLGTVAGTVLAMLFGLAVQSLAKIDGFRIEDAEPLLTMKYQGLVNIGLHGLLVSGIIVSALGAVMDVAMSISSALEEVHAANPALKQQDLFKSGMNIGRDMVGTMTNTLILAFLGCEFTLMLFIYARQMTFYHLFSTPFVSLEIISGLASSLGMILAIPLTALISSSLITQKKKKRK